MSDSSAEYCQSNTKSIITLLHEFLVEFFGKENVIWVEADKRLKVRPMWIPDGGSGFSPPMASLIKMTQVVIDKFNENHKSRLTQSITNLYDTQLIELCDRISENPSDCKYYVSIHHSPFF